MNVVEQNWVQNSDPISSQWEVGLFMRKSGLIGSTVCTGVDDAIPERFVSRYRRDEAGDKSIARPDCIVVGRSVSLRNKRLQRHRPVLSDDDRAIGPERHEHGVSALCCQLTGRCHNVRDVLQSLARNRAQFFQIRLYCKWTETETRLVVLRGQVEKKASRGTRSRAQKVTKIIVAESRRQRARNGDNIGVPDVTLRLQMGRPPVLAFNDGDVGPSRSCNWKNNGSNKFRFEAKEEFFILNSAEAECGTPDQTSRKGARYVDAFSRSDFRLVCCL